MRSFEIMDALTDMDDELLHRAEMDLSNYRGMRKRMNLRWLGKIAAIAAVIMALTMTAFAADAVFNEGRLFGGFFGDSLSDKQVELIEDIGRTFGESVTSNGTTITPIRAVADENTYYLYLRVEAPEDVVLPDLEKEEGYFYDFASKDSYEIEFEYLMNSQGVWEKAKCETHYVITLPDSDPTDNVKDFVIRMVYEGPETIFNGPWPKRLTLCELFICNFNEYDPYIKTVLTGTFRFDIGIHDENREDVKFVIDTDELTFYNEEFDYMVTVDKVTVTPLRIELDCTYTDPSDKYIFPRGGPVQVVMKDGTVVDALDDYFDAKTYPRPDIVAGVVSIGYFVEPIILENIDYLVFGGSEIIDVN